MKNYGLNLEKERAEQSTEDWKFGATSKPCLAQIPEADREQYLPAGEVQRSDREDMQDCPIRAPLNILKTKLTYLYQNKKISDEKRTWLLNHGYVTNDDRIELSDAYISILSGTTRQGNSLKAPLQAIHEHGVVPKALLPLLPSMTWEEYHDPARVTFSIIKLGHEFAARFTINYEQVYEKDFPAVLAEDMLDVAGYAWPIPVDGEYPRTEGTPNHAWVNFKRPEYFAFDNYLDQNVAGDFVKKLASNYDFFSYGYRLFIRERNKQPSLFEKLVALLLRLIRKLST